MLFLIIIFDAAAISLLRPPSTRNAYVFLFEDIITPPVRYHTTDPRRTHVNHAALTETAINARAFAAR